MINIPIWAGILPIVCTASFSASMSLILACLLLGNKKTLPDDKNGKKGRFR